VAHCYIGRVDLLIGHSVCPLLGVGLLLSGKRVPVRLCVHGERSHVGSMLSDGGEHPLASRNHTSPDCPMLGVGTARACCSFPLMVSPSPSP